MTPDPITAPDAFGQGWTLELLYAPGQYDGEESRWIVTIRRARLGQTSVVIEAAQLAILIAQMGGHAHAVARGIHDDSDSAPKTDNDGSSIDGAATAPRATANG